MARGQHVPLSELQEGETYLLSHGFGNSDTVTYTGKSMGKLWIIPIPWKTVYTFTEKGGKTHAVVPEQVKQIIYHQVDDA